MIKFSLNDIYYITYYASYINNDEIVEIFNEKIKKYKSLEDQKIYKATLIEISQKIMANINDDINEIIFDYLLTKDVSIKSIKKIKDLVLKISVKDYLTINKMLNEKLEDIRREKDILSVEEFVELVNDDLTMNGLDSKWIFIAYEYRKIDEKTKFVEINPYLDKFDAAYEDINEVYESLFYDHQDELLNEFFNTINQLDTLNQNKKQEQIKGENKMIKFDLQDIFYITQYDNLWTDEGLVQIFNTFLQEHDIPEDQQKYKDLICDIQDQMQNIPDEVNKIVYKKISTKNFVIEDLEKIRDLVFEISNKNYSDVNELLNGALDNYVSQNEIISTEEFETLLDNSLKSDGLNSMFINMVDSYHSLNEEVEYLQINAYVNGFENKFKDINEVYKEVLKSNCEEILEDFSNQLTTLQEQKDFQIQSTEAKEKLTQ